MKNYKKNDATTKVRILKPILDDWNEIQGDTWMIEKGDRDRVTIRRADRGVKPHENIHGCLMHDISCLCEAYDWCWALYYDDEQGLNLHI